MNTNTNSRLDIPTLLANLPHWVGWTYETRKGQTKPTKVPKHPRTGQNASSTDAGTWGTLDEALAAQDRFNFAGVGFNLSPDVVNLVGVDIDNCFEPDGTLNPRAQEIAAICNSYTEISPSGKGIRIFIRGRKPGPRCKETRYGFEMYDAGRFLTVTGNHLPGTPTNIREDDEAIATVYRMFWPDEPEPELCSRPQLAVNLTDQELLQRIRRAKNGDKFARLYDRGDIQGYPSQSEADLALCSILAFWSESAEQVDRLFRASALFRPKWDATRGQITYGQMTINKALASAPSLPRASSTGLSATLNGRGGPSNIPSVTIPPEKLGYYAVIEGVPQQENTNVGRLVTEIADWLGLVCDETPPSMLRVAASWLVSALIYRRVALKMHFGLVFPNEYDLLKLRYKRYVNKLDR